MNTATETASNIAAIHADAVTIGGDDGHSTRAGHFNCRGCFSLVEFRYLHGDRDKELCTDCL